MEVFLHSSFGTSAKLLFFFLSSISQCFFALLWSVCASVCATLQVLFDVSLQFSQCFSYLFCLLLILLPHFQDSFPLWVRNPECVTYLKFVVLLCFAVGTSQSMCSLKRILGTRLLMRLFYTSCPVHLNLLVILKIDT